MQCKPICWILMLVLAVLFTGSHLQAQQEGKVVMIHPKVGKSLDWQERERYGFFPEIKHFQNAVFLLMPDSTYRIRISYFKNDTLCSKVLSLSKEDFLRDYYAVILEREKEKHQPGREVFVHWANGTSLPGRLLAVQDDALVLGTGRDQKKPIPLNELSQISVVHHASVKKTLLISLLAGGVGAAIGLASGDDEGGWFALTAEEKAVLGFSAFSSIAFFVSGSMAAIKAVDVEIPLKKLAMEKRRSILDAVLNGTYQPRHALSLVGSFDYLQYDQDFAMSAFSLRVQKQYKPRILFSLAYTRSTWSDWQNVFQYETEYESGLTRERLRCNLLSAEITALARATGTVLPFFRWGLAYNSRTKQDYTKSHYQDAKSGVTRDVEDSDQQKESFLGIPLAIGTLIQLHSNVRLELKVKKILTDKQPWQLGIGLQVGQRAFH